jgi:hypothetical protein
MDFYAFLRTGDGKRHQLRSSADRSAPESRRGNMNDIINSVKTILEYGFRGNNIGL